MLLVFDLSGTLVDAQGKLYPDAHSFLKAAKQQGFALALATNLGRGGMRDQLQAAGIEDLFDSLQCAGVHPFKPAPDMLQHAMLETGYGADHTIMIGDSLSDMQTAKSIGVKACAAVWGEGRYENLKPAAPDFVAESFGQLANLLNMETETQSEPR